MPAPGFQPKYCQLLLEKVRAERWQQQLREQRQRGEPLVLVPPAEVACFPVWEMRLEVAAEWTLPAGMQVSKPHQPPDLKKVQTFPAADGFPPLRERRFR